LYCRSAASALRHEQDAEDALQATFLVLARRPDSIRREESLASWLYGVALRTALKAKTLAARQAAASDGAAHATGTTRRGVVAGTARLLDEEESWLPEKYPRPFAVLPKATAEEAARQLGWNKGTPRPAGARPAAVAAEVGSPRARARLRALCAVRWAPCPRCDAGCARRGDRRSRDAFTSGEAVGAVRFGL
jgi:RNA polymerase sigma-70 factor (ECF subfamily)